MTYSVTSKYGRSYLGNKHTTEVHRLSDEQANCQIDEIIKAGHAVAFSPDTLDQAHSDGYDNCAYCIGNSKR